MSGVGAQKTESKKKEWIILSFLGKKVNWIFHKLYTIMHYFSTNQIWSCSTDLMKSK